MYDQKPWYLSKTVWSGIVTALASLGGLLGFQFFEGAEDAAVEVILQLIAAFGGLFAIYGRFTATSKIG